MLFQEILIKLTHHKALQWINAHLWNHKITLCNKRRLNICAWYNIVIISNLSQQFQANAEIDFGNTTEGLKNISYRRQKKLNLFATTDSSKYLLCCYVTLIGRFLLLLAIKPLKPIDMKEAPHRVRTWGENAEHLTYHA